MKKCVISVVGKDCVGIVAKVAVFLAENNINILNITQNITDGFFNMMVIADLQDCPIEIDLVAIGLRSIGDQIGVDIRCQREEIFLRMHRV